MCRPARVDSSVYEEMIVKSGDMSIVSIYTRYGTQGSFIGEGGPELAKYDAGKILARLTILRLAAALTGSPKPWVRDRWI